MILSIIFILLGAFMKAFQDTIHYHWYSSIFSKIKPNTRLHNWLNPEISWINKWKEGYKPLGEKFWGSSRWFVMFTDGWHLIDLFRNCLFICALTFYESYIPYTGFRILDTFIIFVLFSVCFESFFILAEKLKKNND